MSKNKQEEHTQIFWSISRQFQGRQLTVDIEYNVSEAFKLLNSIISNGSTTQKLKEASMILQNAIIIGKPYTNKVSKYTQKKAHD